MIFKSILFLVINIMLNGGSFAQSNMINVYLLPGTGSDDRLFEKLTLPTGFEAKHIQYPVPRKSETMESYARTLANQIDTTTPFVLIGVSIGGMLCTELAEQLNPLKTILVSSAKCRKELPRHYRFQRFVPFNKLFGPRAIKALSPLAQAVVEPDSKKFRPTFKAMLKVKHPKFIKRAVNMIINWERKEWPLGIIHIHGEKDHTLPIRNVKPSIIVKGGSHMMMLTRGEEISQIIQQVLLEK